MQNRIDSAVVVLYNPDFKVFDNIVTYINNINTLYIVDNSIIKHNIIEKLLPFKNIKIIHSGNNIGIAEALNRALYQSNRDNYKQLITLDQDTSFNAGDLDKFIENFYKYNTPNIALISPLHNKKFINIDNPIVEKNYTMTSANIINVQVALANGGYDEKLFIDEVDHEFCFRVRLNGYKILEYREVAVNHSLGVRAKNNSKVKIYPSVRIYYMVRNYLYLKNKYYKDEKIFFKQRDKYLVKFFIYQLLYSSHKIQDIKMIFKGILDYKNKKFGKLLDE